MIIMKNKTIKKIAYILVVSLMMSMLTGCSFIPELQLTQEQSELIAEYSAGLLCKYQIGHTMGLTPLSARDFQVAAPVVVEEPVSEETIEESEPSQAEYEDVSVDNPADGEIEMVSSNIPIGSVYGLDNVDISYTYYEFTEIYPKQESDDLVFSMQATPGNQLLVVHFDMTNLNAEPLDINMTTGTVKARVTINGGSRIPAQFTILDSDLQNFVGTLDGGSVADVVLVFDVPVNEYEEISSINIILKGEEGENLYRLL